MITVEAFAFIHNLLLKKKPYTRCKYISYSDNRYECIKNNRSRLLLQSLKLKLITALLFNALKI